MDVPTIKIVSFVVIFVSIFSIAGYACGNCNSKNGWYDTTNTRWVDFDQCTQKEQVQQEYRVYNCSLDCTYSVTNHQWIDNYQTRDKEDGTQCYDGLYCNVNDVCIEGICGGSIRNCSCPASGCVNNDYYDYQGSGICNGSFKCYCEPTITINDPRCVESFIEVNKTANPTEISLGETSVTLIVKGIGTGIVGTNITIIDFLPDYVNLDSDLSGECVYDNSTRKITCNLNDLNAGETKTVNFNITLTKLGNVLIDLYPESGVSYTNNLGNNTFVSFPETYVNVLAYAGATEICNDGIDNNLNDLIDCSDPDCNGNSYCVQSTSTSSSGGMIGGGGGITINPAVCGNGKCEYGETCSNCPKDCLKQGQVCCSKIAVDGNCCIDYDCGKGYECTVAKKCQPLYVENETTGGNQTVCQEDWTCADWSECVNSIQTRTCVDKNDCGTTVNKPGETQKCETPTPISGLFTFIESPIGLVTLASILILFLIMFFLRRK